LPVRVAKPRWKRWSGLPLPKTGLGLSGTNARPATTSQVYLRRPNHLDDHKDDRSNPFLKSKNPRTLLSASTPGPLAVKVSSSTSPARRTTNLLSPLSAPPANAGRALQLRCDKALERARIAGVCAWPLVLTRAGRAGVRKPRGPGSIGEAAPP